MPSGLNTARHGSPVDAGDVLEVQVNEELLRAALMNALERIDRLERKMLGRANAISQGVCAECGIEKGRVG